MAGIEIEYLLNRLGDHIVEKKYVEVDEDILFILDDKKLEDTDKETGLKTIKYVGRLIVFIRNKDRTKDDLIIHQEYAEINKQDYKNKFYKSRLVMNFLNLNFALVVAVSINQRKLKQQEEEQQKIVSPVDDNVIEQLAGKEITDAE